MYAIKDEDIAGLIDNKNDHQLLIDDENMLPSFSNPYTDIVKTAESSDGECHKDETQVISQGEAVDFLEKLILYFKNPNEIPDHQLLTAKYLQDRVPKNEAQSQKQKTLKDFFLNK